MTDQQRRRLFPQVVAAMREMVDADLTDQEIGARLGVSPDTVHAWRVDLDLPASTRQRGPRRTELRRRRVRELVVDEELSDTQIAERLGVTPRTVLRDRQAMNLPPAVAKFVKGERRGTSAPHGTPRRYAYDRCRCGPCRKANAAEKRNYLHKIGRHKRWRVHCPDCGRCHLVDDPQNFTCPNTPKEGTPL